MCILDISAKNILVIAYAFVISLALFSLLTALTSWLTPSQSSTIGIGYNGADTISAELRNSFCDLLSMHSYMNFSAKGE